MVDGPIRWPAAMMETWTIDPLKAGRDSGDAVSDISKVEKQKVSRGGHNCSVQ